MKGQKMVSSKMLKDSIWAFLEQGASLWKCHDKNWRNLFLFWHRFFLPVHFTHQSAAFDLNLGVVSVPLNTHSAAVSPPPLPPSDLEASLAGLKMLNCTAGQQEMPPRQVLPSSTHTTLSDQSWEPSRQTAGQQEGLCLTRLELATLVSSSGIGR